VASGEGGSCFSRRVSRVSLVSPPRSSPDPQGVRFPSRSVDRQMIFRRTGSRSLASRSRRVELRSARSQKTASVVVIRLRLRTPVSKSSASREEPKLRATWERVARAVRTTRDWLVSAMWATNDPPGTRRNSDGGVDREGAADLPAIAQPQRHGNADRLQDPQHCRAPNA